MEGFYGVGGNFGLGVVETGVGAGIKSLKDSCDDFVEAADAFERYREIGDHE